MHPDDPNWPGSSYETPKSMKRALYDPLNSAAARPKYHPTPLVSQTDLFLRSKDVDDSAINDRVNMHRPGFRDASLTNSKKSAHRFDRRSTSRDRIKGPKRVRDDFSPSRESTRAFSRGRDDHDFFFESKLKSNIGLDHQYQKAESRRDKNHKEFSQRPTLTSLTSGEDRLTGLDVRTPIAERPFDNDKRQNDRRVESTEEQGIVHIVQLFRELARLTSEVNQLKEAQRKEEINFQTYNNIASALSQIPNMAPTNISSSLADSLLKQAQLKQNVEESFEAIGNVWLDVIDMFKTEVSRTIDERLEVAMMSIKQEEATLHNSTAVKPGMSGKRWSEASTTSPSIDSREKGRSMNRSGGTYRPIEFDDRLLTDYRHGRTSYKRRRLAPLSPTRKVEGSNREELDQSTLLSQMKTQIEQQAQTLENLTKSENNRKCQ